MPALIIGEGPNEGNWFKLSKRTLTGGRDPSNAIQLTDDKVSRKHFQVRFDEGLYLLTDLRSHNGSFINGNRIQEALLKDGDVIQVGETMLVFTDGEVTDRTDALQYYKQISRHLREDQTITDRPGD
jgi:pSer/pThr/pTyr-binding forkhead associated (FHA) protein